MCEWLKLVIKPMESKENEWFDSHYSAQEVQPIEYMQMTMSLSLIHI